MALKSFVKISGINNLSDARYCAGMTVDVLGFSFEPNHPNYMDPDKFTAIIEWLSGADFCAEFENSTAEEIKETLQQYPDIQYIQIRNPNLLPALQLLQKPNILRLPAETLDSNQNLGELMESSSSDVAFFLFEDDDNQAPDVDMALTLAEQFPILLGFGLTKENVHLILEKSNLKGIALRGGDEIKPGYKDFDDLADILETLEIDDLE